MQLKAFVRQKYNPVHYCREISGVKNSSHGKKYIFHGVLSVMCNVIKKNLTPLYEREKIL